MQQANEDTEWNDILRSKGIIPQKSKDIEVSEEQIISIIENVVDEKSAKRKDLSDMNLEELDELEDSEDEAVLKEYRRKRIAEIKLLAENSKFGRVQEISGRDYIDEVNNAGENIWVVLHLYANGVPMCSLINHYMSELALMFPQTKFLKSIANTCIPNFPEKNLPSIFIYFEGVLKKQIIGAIELRGEKLTREEFEYLLGKYGAIKTNIKEDPKQKIYDKLQSDLDYSTMN